MQGLFIVGFWWFIWKQARWQMINGHEGLYMEWSHILNLDTLKDIYTNNLNEWFNTKCDLMAWDGEDSKEMLWGTKQGWRASDGLAEEPS